MSRIYTDLAMESGRVGAGEQVEGVHIARSESGGVTRLRVDVLNERGERETGKRTLEELEALLEDCCREVPQVLLGGLSHRWRQLQKENAPLRAVINGRLHSVPEDFYDGMLLSRLPKAGQTIRLAELLGRTLGECQPGIGDWWLACRAEALAAEGRFRLERDPERFYNSQVTAL